MSERQRSAARTGLVTAVLLALVASTLVLGEPSRPATASIVRPIVTVQAFCTVPTIVDVAAGEAPRGLAAVGELLGLDDPVAGEPARDVDIVETEAGTVFVHLEGRQLRYAVLGRSGLPILSPTGPDTPPRTYRVVELDASLVTSRPLVAAGPDGAVVLFGGPSDATAVLSLTAEGLTAPAGELTIARTTDGPRQAELRAMPGRVTYHAGVLWLTGDDGSLWTYDPAVAGGDAWAELATGVRGPLLARGDQAVHVVVDGDEGPAVRSFATPTAAPTVRPIDDPGIQVEAATFPASTTPAFAVRSEDGPGIGLLRPDVDPRGGAPDVVWSTGDHAATTVVGVTATSTAAALLHDADGLLRYAVLDATGGYAGSFGAATRDPDCLSSGGWPDVATVVTPTGAGSLLHLHDPGGRFDCIVDGRQGIEDVDARCAPGGLWSLDKGTAPPTGFTLEITRALEEFQAEEAERRSDEADDEEPAEPEEADPDAAAAGSGLQEAFEEVGLGVVEVDEDLAEVCAEEEVVSVEPPNLDAAEPVGDSAIAVSWRWDGGLCLPDRYVVSTCVVPSDGGDCTDRNDTEVVDRDGGSNRYATEVRARPDRTYRVTVSASKRGVRSDASAALLVRMPPSVPAPPTDVRASLSGGVWSVSWASCLDDGSCEQRPDGFVVMVEGCEGDSLGSLRDTLGASQRSATYDVSGAGFPGADLLGRRVVFRVAATAAGATSERVTAGACTETVRDGRDASYGDAGLSLALSGRTSTMTLDGPARSSALTRLFGTSSYDDVAARLVRSGSQTPARAGALGGSVSFEVERCQLSGWTVELTPRRGGTDLARHRSRISGVPAACGWAVTDDTRPAVSVARDGGAGFVADLRLTGLAQDVANDKVAGASAAMTCRLAAGDTREIDLGAASVDGDRLRVRGTVPTVLDVAGACTVRPTIRGRDGETIRPHAAPLDLTPVAGRVVQLVAEHAADRVVQAGFERRYDGTGGPVGRRDRWVELRFGSAAGVSCTMSAGSSSWTVELRPDPSRAPCESNGGFSRPRFRESDLSGRNGDLRVRVTLAGHGSETAVRTVRVCPTPDEQRPRPPCENVPPCEWDPALDANDPACVPPPCPWDPALPVDDPGCFEPCPYDSSIPIDDRDCVEPTGPCEWDPSIPEDDPACQPPPCEWDPSLPADDPACRPPDDEDPGPDP